MIIFKTTVKINRLLESHFICSRAITFQIYWFPQMFLYNLATVSVLAQSSSVTMITSKLLSFLFLPFSNYFSAVEGIQVWGEQSFCKTFFPICSSTYF